MNVLFVCVANAGRSVLAERIFRARARAGDEARSAGSAPAREAHPVVIESLAEIGIDARDHVPQPIGAALVEWADVIVATCDDACPVVPGKRYVQWQLPDPNGRPPVEVGAIRDEVTARVETLLAELGETEREQVADFGE
jgi:arsenate reductase